MLCPFFGRDQYRTNVKLAPDSPAGILSVTVDATERTRFSRSNDLDDIGQGQRSSHATHPLMLLIICIKYGKNPSGTVDATGRTQKVNRQTDGQTDRETGWIQYTPPPTNFVAGGYNKDVLNISFLPTSCPVPIMHILEISPDSQVHGANMGPTWILSAPGGPHVGLINLAMWVAFV